MIVMVVVMVRQDAQEDDNDAVNHLYDDDGYGGDRDDNGDEDTI